MTQSLMQHTQKAPTQVCSVMVRLRVVAPYLIVFIAYMSLVMAQNVLMVLYFSVKKKGTYCTLVCSIEYFDSYEL